MIGLLRIILCWVLLVTSSKAVMPDWLVLNVSAPTKLVKLSSDTLRMTNGIFFRDFITYPDFTTVDYYSLEKESSLLRALSPEAVIELDGVVYNIGGVVARIPRAYMNRTALNKNVTADKNAFHYVKHKVMKPESDFPYVPRRGAPKNIVWPPKGLRMNVLFKAPFGAPKEHQKLTVVIHYEMYDGMPCLTKWLSVIGPGTSGVKMRVLSVEYLALNRQWAPANFAAGGIPNPLGSRNDWSGWFFIQTDQSHGTVVNWGTDPEQKNMPGSYEPVVNCSHGYPSPDIPVNSGVKSFKVFELLIGSSDPERTSLARHRMQRLLAPHTQENPIFFHMTNSSSEAIRAVVDQLAEVGFEMLIYSFGSGFDIESTNKSYIKQIAADIAYANSKGIEVGGYDMIAWTRTVKPEWLAINPKTNKSMNSACFASGWYDHLLNQMLSFIDQTGLSMVETDGPYHGYECGAQHHKHHTGFQDSVYIQQKLQGDFYRELRKREIYINQPDFYFYQGGSRTGLGYDENQYSLPRWQDISISRQSIYDDTYKLPPTAGWMFVPLVVYHYGGKAAMFEPLSQHRKEYEWALAQYLGAGVAAFYRGYRIYDDDQTKALVKKWVSFYKRYRDIITSDIVHIRRPDMQNYDSFMHVNPFLGTRALAMVFNPTPKVILTDMNLPLYYTGLTDYACVSEQGNACQVRQLDSDYNVEVSLNMQPYSITWFVVFQVSDNSETEE